MLIVIIFVVVVLEALHIAFSDHDISFNCKATLLNLSGNHRFSQHSAAGKSQTGILGLAPGNVTRMEVTLPTTKFMSRSE
jgi:hypothetical protein